MSLQVTTFVNGRWRQNCYLIANRQKDVLMVDPGSDATTSHVRTTLPNGLDQLRESHGARKRPSRAEERYRVSRYQTVTQRRTRPHRPGFGGFPGG